MIYGATLPAFPTATCISLHSSASVAFAGQSLAVYMLPLHAVPL